MISHYDQGQYHGTRLSFLEKRKVLWNVLWKYHFSRLIESSFHVLELGAAHCDFINAVECRQRTAVDRWDGVQEHAAVGVTPWTRDVTDLSFLDDHSVDFAFASNLFEHLSQNDFIVCLGQLRAKLRPRGILAIVQPNFKYAYREYFDDYTHVTIYTEKGLSDLLEANGFAVEECRGRFLPFSLNSWWPVLPCLIRLYLWLPFKPFAKQMFIRARVKQSAAGAQKV